MKLVVAMSVDAYAKELEQLFRKHRTPVFSEMEMNGFRLEEASGLQTNWFGSSHTPTYSKLTFAFVDENKANELLASIADYNRTHDPDHPIRAFLLNVEKRV